MSSWLIDVGTNSIKFHIGTFGADGVPQTVLDRADVTRLGEGMEADGAIQRPALERAIAAIAGFPAYVIPLLGGRI